jgi:hypothetical protein
MVPSVLNVFYSSDPIRGTSAGFQVPLKEALEAEVRT